MNAVSMVMLLLVAWTAAGLMYVYRYRGSARYTSFGEYFRKGWPVFSPLNGLLYLTTQARAARPILDPADFPELETLREHWQTFRDEASWLYQQGYFDATKRPGTPGYYDVGFRTFFKYGWSRFYLNWYGYTHQSARKLCPRTVRILSAVPSVNGAMFALLPAGGKLTRHADPLACSMRYHLGLATPNSPSCFINIDGEDRYWRDGEVLMFDETYLHFAQNDSDQPRLILMCDIDRPTRLPGTIFNFFYKALPRLTVVPNTLDDRRGFANIVFGSVGPLLQRSKELKARNRSAYRLLKWSVNGGLLAIFLATVWGLTLFVVELVRRGSSL